MIDEPTRCDRSGRLQFRDGFLTLVIAIAVPGILGGPVVKAQQDPGRPANAQPDVMSGSESSVDRVDELPLEQQPYRIRCWIRFDPALSLDGPATRRILQDWQNQIRRYIGAPWQVELAPDLGPLALSDSLERPALVVVRDRTRDVDKGWLIDIRPEGTGFRVTGREWDDATQRIGSLFARNAASRHDLPRNLLKLCRAMFAPVAEVRSRDNEFADLLVQGGLLRPATPMGLLVQPDTIFRPVRVFLNRDDTVRQIQDIDWSYLRVMRVDTPVARAQIVSALRRPLTGRTRRRNRLLALGLRPADVNTELTFLTKPDRLPAAGYRVTAQRYPNGQILEVGLTDRDGRVIIPPRFIDGLVRVRVIAGDREPLVEFPVMPGDTIQRRTLIIDPKPQVVTLQVRMTALIDRMLDTIASRSRLEKLMEIRAAGERWNDVRALIDQHDGLPNAERYQAELDALVTEAKAAQEEQRLAYWTPSTQRIAAEMQSMIDTYLNDEVIDEFREELP